ncbi:phage tail spike protein [Rossellomorea marisflavi]|uniref:phage tail spike protein n=1 Tax=Rossellomorea marisflavi TaxID=189381 RepID=UPI0025B037B9|nr:phage tail spike protein [Rossellomorea marisflavi]WJV20679.1 phage tail spike protein [Rossellomorea marisflavi]
MYSIDRSKKPKSIRLFLVANDKNRTVIEELYHITPPKNVGNFGKINELTFSIPFKTEIRHKLVPNPHLKKVREKLLIKTVSGQDEEYFLINKIKKSSSDTEIMDVECYGLGYQLWYRKIIDYERPSLTLISVVSETLKGTGWSIGYFNPEFNLKYRQFDVSSKRKLEFIYEIAETFEVVPIFDSVKKQIHFYKEDEINKYKGFWIESGKYVNSIDMEIDADQIVTRLHIRGADNLRVNAVNPTGQSYIDDFSYLMYPFEMDSQENVIRSSNFMSDDLCKALVKYNRFVSSYKGEFKSLLDKKKELQEEKTVVENNLTELKIELQIILDQIELYSGTGISKADLIKERNRKNREISNANKAISDIETKITMLDESIAQVRESFSLSNFLNEELMYELETNWIQEDEWSDDNKIDENDLYEAGLKHLSEINKPPVNISTNIINFFSMISEQHNWDRLKLGDIVRIKNSTLDIDIKTTITKLSIDYDSDSIDIELSNSKHSNAITYEEMIKRSFYTISKVNTDYNARKIDWKKMAYNFNLRNDRISDTPTDPIIGRSGKSISHKVNDNGSVNLTFEWDYPNYEKTKKNSDNIDGFFLHLYSSIDESQYMFGSQMSKETIIPLESTLRRYTFTGLPANVYYTLGIKAYRTVDEDVNSEGVIFSSMISPTLITEDPYLPSPKTEFTGDITGRVNGVNFSVGSEPPPEPVNNDRWTKLVGTEATEMIFVEESEETKDWKPVKSAVSDTVGGKSVSLENNPDTIPVRDFEGKIYVDIYGSATSLNGIESTDFLTRENIGVPDGVVGLDSTGNIPSVLLGNSTRMNSGIYIGDGSPERFVPVGFDPTLVKVIPFDNLDSSIIINSSFGGLKLLTDLNGLSLTGVNGSSSEIYGKLDIQGFLTGNDLDTYANKAGVSYFWEAYSYSNV